MSASQDANDHDPLAGKPRMKEATHCAVQSCEWCPAYAALRCAVLWPGLEDLYLHIYNQLSSGTAWGRLLLRGLGGNDDDLQAVHHKAWQVRPGDADAPASQRSHAACLLRSSECRRSVACLPACVGHACMHARRACVRARVQVWHNQTVPPYAISAPLPEDAPLLLVERAAALGLAQPDLYASLGEPAAAQRALVPAAAQRASP